MINVDLGAGLMLWKGRPVPIVEGLFQETEEVLFFDRQHSLFDYFVTVRVRDGRRRWNPSCEAHELVVISDKLIASGECVLAGVGFGFDGRTSTLQFRPLGNGMDWIFDDGEKAAARLQEMQLPGCTYTIPV